MPSDSRSNSCLRFSTMLANLGSRIRRMLSRQVETSSSEESVTEELIADHQSTDSDEFQIDSSETGEVSEIDADDEEDIETNQSPSPSSNKHKDEKKHTKIPIEEIEGQQENVKPQTTNEDSNDDDDDDDDDDSVVSLNEDKDMDDKKQTKDYTNISCRIRISRTNKSEYNKLSKLKRRLMSNHPITFTEHKYTQTDDRLTVLKVTKGVEIVSPTASKTTGTRCETSMTSMNGNLSEVKPQDAQLEGRETETTEYRKTETHEDDETETLKSRKTGTSEDRESVTSPDECVSDTSNTQDGTLIFDMVLPLYLNNKLHELCKGYVSRSKTVEYCAIILDDRVPFHQLFSIIKHIYAQLSTPSKKSRRLRDRATQTGEEAWNRGARQMVECMLCPENSNKAFDEASAARILKFIGGIYDLESNLSDFFNCRDISEFAASGIPNKFQEQISHLRLGFFKTLREHGTMNRWLKLPRNESRNLRSALRIHLQRQLDLLVGSCLHWYKECDLQSMDLDLSGFLTEYLFAYETYVLTIKFQYSREDFAGKFEKLRVNSTGDKKSCKSFETEVCHESEVTKQETTECTIEDAESTVTASSCGSVDEIEQELEELEKELRGNKWGYFNLFEQTDGIFDRGTEYWIDGQASVSKSRKGAKGDYIDRPKKKKTRGIPNKHLQNECTVLIQNEHDNLDDCKAANRTDETKPEPEVNKVVLDPLFPCEIEESNVDTRHLKNAPAVVITGKKSDYENLEVTYETPEKKPNRKRQNRRRKQRANRQNALQFGLNTNNCADDEYESSSADDEGEEFDQSRITYRENPL